MHLELASVKKHTQKKISPGKDYKDRIKAQVCLTLHIRDHVCKINTRRDFKLVLKLAETKQKADWLSDM